MAGRVLVWTRTLWRNRHAIMSKGAKRTTSSVKKVQGKSTGKAGSAKSPATRRTRKPAVPAAQANSAPRKAGKSATPDSCDGMPAQSRPGSTPAEGFDPSVDGDDILDIQDFSATMPAAMFQRHFEAGLVMTPDENTVKETAEIMMLCYARLVNWASSMGMDDGSRGRESAGFELARALKRIRADLDGIKNLKKCTGTAYPRTLAALMFGATIEPSLPLHPLLKRVECPPNLAFREGMKSRASNYKTAPTDMYWWAMHRIDDAICTWRKCRKLLREKGEKPIKPREQRLLALPKFGESDRDGWRTLILGDGGENQGLLRVLMKRQLPTISYHSKKHGPVFEKAFDAMWADYSPNQPDSA